MRPQSIKQPIQRHPKGAIRVHERASGLRYEVVFDAPPDPQTGKRRQISRTFTTEAEARHALQNVGNFYVRPPLSGASKWDVPHGPTNALREAQQFMTTAVAQLDYAVYPNIVEQLRHAYHCIESAAQAWNTTNRRPPSSAQRRAPYVIYRLICDERPFYVGRTQDIEKRYNTHMSQAIIADEPSATSRFIRAAFAQEKAITYEIVESATSLKEAREKESIWLRVTLQQGFDVTNHLT